MPYYVNKRGSGPKPYKIINKDTGRVVGSSSSQEKALSSARARQASHHGWEPTGRPRRRR